VSLSKAERPAMGLRAALVRFHGSPGNPPDVPFPAAGRPPGEAWSLEFPHDNGRLPDSTDASRTMVLEGQRRPS
jgi:hypothetical protein